MNLIIAGKYEKDGQEHAVAVVLENAPSDLSADNVYMEAQYERIRTEITEDCGGKTPAVSFHIWTVDV